jgi:hypothetical protein
VVRTGLHEGRTRSPLPRVESEPKSCLILLAIRHSPSETDAKEEAPARWGWPGLQGSLCCSWIGCVWAWGECLSTAVNVLGFESFLLGSCTHSLLIRSPGQGGSTGASLSSKRRDSRLRVKPRADFHNTNRLHWRGAWIARCGSSPCPLSKTTLPPSSCGPRRAC